MHRIETIFHWRRTKGLILYALPTHDAKLLHGVRTSRIKCDYGEDNTDSRVSVSDVRTVAPIRKGTARKPAPGWN